MRSSLGTFFALILVALLPVSSGLAADDALKVEDRTEQRLKTIASQLRCPVCQGETVYDSHATLAREIKRLIRQQVAEGRSDLDIKKFFVERYGEFVLMEPAANGWGLFVWAFPLLALVCGGLVIGALVRRRHEPEPALEHAVGDTDEFFDRLERLEP